MTRASQRSSLLAVGMLLTLLATHGQAGELDDLVKHANQGQNKVKRYLQTLSERAADAASGEAPPLSDAEWRTLREAEVAIDGAPFRRLQANSNALQYEVENFRANTFEAYAAKGDQTGSLASLQAMGRTMLVPHLNQLIQERFPSGANLPELQQIQARNAIAGRLGKASPLGTPYQPVLSDAEKVAGLSLFWSQARSYFVLFDQVPELDWDAAYLRFLPKVQAAKTTRDYYRVLAQFAALLHDSHSNVYPPTELEAELYSRPPMRTALVEGKVLVTSLQSPTLQRQIAIGDEIVAIDGIPTRQYAEERLAPYLGSTTMQDLQARLYGSQLLAGAEDKALQLAMRKADGERYKVKVARSGYTDVTPRQFFEFRLLPGNIAYLSLDHFETDQGLRLFQEHLPAIQAARGLVLDLRRNSSNGNGHIILSRLTEQAIPKGAYSVRSDGGMDHTRFDSLRLRPDTAPEFFKPEPSDPYRGPVVVLAGAQTAASAEEFLMAFDVLQRGKIVGETTAGVSGATLVFKLPGDGLGRLTVRRDSYPDGKPIVGVGITPQITVSPSAADIRNGRDAVLERAVAEIEQIASH